MTREKLTPDNPDFENFIGVIGKMWHQLREKGRLEEEDARTLHRLLGQHLWAIDSERRQARRTAAARVTQANGG